jgi:succinyl-CoA synthetase alpha subunit
MLRHDLLQLASMSISIYGSVKEAVHRLKPHMTAAFIPALLVADAIIEATNTKIPLLVAVAEEIPVQDHMKVMSVLHS